MIINTLKKDSIRKYKILYVLILFAVQSHGQVTIGSSSEPRAGALLDITQGEITTKGLNLPRVALKSLTATNNDLRTTIEGIDTSSGSAWTLTEHEGLVIYNVNEQNCTGIAPGTFVWMEDKWQAISKSSNAIHNEDLYLPNCYMVAPGTKTISIPVKKAFAIWKYYGWSEINRLPAETVSGTLSASIYWQDADIVESVSVSGSNVNDMISVQLKGTPTKGNAVIALRDGSNTIRWSWHIWVTDNPGSSNLRGNGMQWMDRFMGATSNEAGNPKSIGLNYQWGRKDPFPGYSDFSGGITTISGDVNAINTSWSTNMDSKTNLKRSISNPIAFIKSSAGNYDWYNYNDTDPYLRWDNRWSKTECGVSKKTAFDPCPEGWKVPGYEDNDNQSPWKGLEAYSGSAYGVPSEYGYTWTEARGVPSSIGNFGYYPATGFRSAGNGDLVSANRYGVHGYTWTSAPFVYQFGDSSWLSAYSFHYTVGRSDVYPNIDPAVHTWGYNAYRGSGYSVRCIKE